LNEHKKARLSNVSIEKPVSHPQLAEAMRESDIFILPSRIEGMPKSYAGSGRDGFALHCFSDYKTPSVADGVTGFQVETFEQMLDRFAVADSGCGFEAQNERGGNKLRKQFDWDHVAAQWEATFAEVLCQPQASGLR